MFRDLKTYSKQENIDGAPSVIHTTFEPIHDERNALHIRDDARDVPNAHVATSGT